MPLPVPPGGYFGGELQIIGPAIFEGKSPTPVYLLIRDDEVQLLTPASIGDRRSGPQRTPFAPSIRIH